MRLIADFGVQIEPSNNYYTAGTSAFKGGRTSSW